MLSSCFCCLQVGPTSVQITTPERHRVLGYSSIVNDVYYASEVKGVSYCTYVRYVAGLSKGVSKQMLVLADYKSLCKLSCIQMDMCLLNWLNADSIAIKSNFFT